MWSWSILVHDPDNEEIMGKHSHSQSIINYFYICYSAHVLIQQKCPPANTQMTQKYSPFTS